jgi:hypothetical protein
MAPTLTHWLISARCLFMASMPAIGMTRAAPVPRAGRSSTSSDGAEQVALRRPFQQASPAGTVGRLRPGKPPVVADARTRAALALRRPSIALRATEPLAGSARMRVGVPWLSNPGGMSQRFRSAKRFGKANGGFILNPDFDRPAGKFPRDRGARQPGKVFLKASWASRSLCGYRGRPDMLLKCKILDLRFQALPDELTACHSSLGGEFGEWIDVVKDASLFCKSGIPDLPTMLVPAQPVLCVLSIAN